MKSPTPGEVMHTYRFKLLADQSKYSRTAPTFNKTTNTWSGAAAVNWNGIRRICEAADMTKYLLYPLPVSEMDNNPQIPYSEQNPGW